MAISSMLFLGAIAVVAIYAVMLYNGLVALKHAVARDWAPFSAASSDFRAAA